MTDNPQSRRDFLDIAGKTVAGVAAGASLIGAPSAAVAAGATGGRLAACDGGPLVYPGAHWEQAGDLKSLGLSEAGLASLTPFLKSLDTTAMMVVVDGKVVYQYGDVAKVSYIASCRKSVLAMVYGNYVASGQIKLDATLRDLQMDDVGGLLPVELGATVDDLLTARSGIFHPAAYLGDATASAPPRGSQKPGRFFMYNNWDFNAVGGVFEKTTGKKIYQALFDDLVTPLQMEDFDLASHKMEGDATRSRYLGYPMNFSTRDLARIAHLMLREGNWNGRQVVPKDWTHKITELVTPVDSINPPFWRGYGQGLNWGYGRLWWVWADHDLEGPLAGAYTGWGVGGQFITVLPALKMAIAHKTIAGGKDANGRRKQVPVTQYQAVLMHVIAATEMGGIDPRI